MNRSRMLTVRLETPEDIADIHRINESAFGEPLDADLVDKLRDRGMLTISLVAISDSHIVGHIAFSPVTIKSNKPTFQALGLGPMAVLPKYQRRGIGSHLVRASLQICRKRGYEIIVVVGHPGYYPRFGFVPARLKGLECEFEVSSDTWMMKELKEGARGGRKGTVFYQPEFREVT